MKIPVYNKENKEVGHVEVSETVFGRAWNGNLIHQFVLAKAANRRKPIAHTKGRGEVRGGGKKPWAQKGTGHARHGSIRSPLWKGGGVTFGPKKTRSFEQKINKKVARLALYIALSQKLRDGELRVIESLRIDQPKTKELRWLPISTLLVPDSANKNIFRASKNLPKTKSIQASSLGAEDVLKYKNVLIDQEAIAAIK